MEISGLSNISMTTQAAKMKAGTTESKAFESILETAAKGMDSAELKKACVDMESYFVGMMFKEMRKTIHSEDSIFKKSQTEEVFQEMLDEEFARNLANGRGMGLADMLYKQISRESNAVVQSVATDDDE